MGLVRRFDKKVSLRRRKDGAWVLRIEECGPEGPDGKKLPVRCLLRGQLAEISAKGVFALVLQQSAEKGIFCAEGPVPVGKGELLHMYKISPAMLARGVSEHFRLDEQAAHQ